MRRVLGLIATRVLRTRYRIALLLAVVIFGVVGVAQLVGSNDEPGLGLRPDPGLALTVSPTEPDDGEAVAPTATGSTANPEARRVADAFVAAWLDHRDVDSKSWLAGLRPHITDALAGKLTRVDPASVPADRVVGAPELIPHSNVLVEFTVPVDSGLLRLYVVSVDHQWLVDFVDWERQ